ncbi:MAG: hypothetical protein IJZ34_14070 [Lachnospiraceae bacterium]|nr:hypothetical protein [Lachnospiraceae bacterium]
MDENYREIDGGVYDDQDSDIHHGLLDVVEDLKGNTDTNCVKEIGNKGTTSEKSFLDKCLARQFAKFIWSKKRPVSIRDDKIVRYIIDFMPTLD